ncbi:MAG: glycosyltransferase [Acidimicrobiales bacterium]
MHVRRERVFRWFDWPVYLAITAAAVGVGLWAFRSWMQDNVWGDRPWVGLLITALAGIGLVMYGVRWLTLPLLRRPVHQPPSPGLRVGVATTFVPGSEPLEMLELTVQALVDMEYPHDTWVLDEGDSAEVRELCVRLGARHFTRKHRAEYQTEEGRYEARTKHGNYNAWLAEGAFERYDVIVNFDPDHIPEAHFLERVLGYFDDPDIGYVQAAQVYYNQAAGFIARGAAEETYAYYSSVQMASYALGYPIVTGCHTAHRTAALREVGGFAPHEADDLLVTVYYRTTRWRGIYVPETLAQGLVPTDWPGYLKQQRRWARSVLDVKFRWFPKVARKLGRVERAVSLCHGLHYLTGLGTVAGIVLLGYLLVTGTPAGAFSPSVMLRALALAGVLQACEFYRQRFFLNPRVEAGFHLRSGILRFGKWPYVLLALFDVVRSRHHAYLMTRKMRGRDGYLLIRPHLAGAALVAAAWALGSARGASRGNVLLIAAAVFVVTSLALCVSELREPPASFDPELAARRPRLAPGERQGGRLAQPATPGRADERMLESA